MKKLIIVAAMAVSVLTGYSQTDKTIVPPSTDKPLFGVNMDWTATNWVFIPYASYLVEKKTFGGGAAALYTIDKHIWVGARVQTFGNNFGAAAVQANIQQPFQVAGITVVPFLTTAVGLGSNDIYASAGGGALITFHQWVFKNWTLEAGLVGDYEHYVFGSTSGNQVNLGPMLHATF